MNFDGGVKLKPNMLQGIYSEASSDFQKIAVEDFIRVHMLDEQAASRLREEPSAVQNVIINRTMEGVRNASATVISLIRKTKCVASGAGKKSKLPGAVEAFIQEYNIDEKAATALLQEDEAIQQAVLDRGPLTSARNKGAAVMGRIAKAKQAQSNVARLATAQAQSNIARVDQSRIQTSLIGQFIANHEIHDKAAPQHSREDLAIRQALLECSSIIGAQKQSLAVIGHGGKASQVPAPLTPGAHMPAATHVNDCNDPLSMPYAPGVHLGLSFHANTHMPKLPPWRRMNDMSSAVPALLGSYDAKACLLEAIEEPKELDRQSTSASSNHDDDLPSTPSELSVDKTLIALPPGLEEFALNVDSSDPTKLEEPIMYSPHAMQYRTSQQITDMKERAKCVPPPITSASPIIEQHADTQEATSGRTTIASKWQTMWSVEHKSHYYWHVSTGETTWEQPEEDGDAKSIQSQGHIGKIPGEYLCVKHWEPSKEFESVMAIMHGDRLRVTWTDDSKDGWAYGTCIGDEKRQGYFPQQCVAVPKRPPCNFIVGQKYTVSDHFKPPAQQGGYLRVAPGDAVIIVHQDQEGDANLWVFASRVNGTDESGWLPEAVIAV